MKLQVTSTRILGLSVLALIGNAALGEAPQTAASVVSPARSASKTIIVASNGGDPAQAQEAPAAETWQSADNAYAFANAMGDLNVYTGRASSGSHTLIIPKESPDPKSLSEVEEDMNVMAHILNKAVTPRDEKGRRAMGIFVHSGYTGVAAPKNLYLEGYGAMFFLNVNFPLVAPAEKQDAQAKDETSSEWEEARQELHRPSGQVFDFNLPAMTPPGGSAEEYDADKVEELKSELVNSLKNAAHIRKLQSDETVTIVVTGHGTTPKGVSRRSVVGPGRGVNSSTVRIVNSESRSTKLILRAKKSDLEAFQKDKMSVEDLRKKVTVMAF